MSKSPNHFNGREGWKADMIVMHITDGNYDGAISWLTNPVSRVSSHYIVAKDGRKEQLVDFQDASWSNGTSTDPNSNVYYGKSLNNIVRERKTNANFYTYTIEHEGFLNEEGKLTEAQYQSSLSVVKDIITDMKNRYGITFVPDREHLIGHSDVNPEARPNCPGKLFPYDRFLNDIKVWMGIIVPLKFNIGDTVIIKETAKTYVTGQNIASFVKNRPSKIVQINANKYLIEYNGILIGWVFDYDLDRANLQVTKPLIKGARVIIKNSATKFATGQNIASFAKNRPSIANVVNSDRSLVMYNGVIVGWVFNKDLEVI